MKIKFQLLDCDYFMNGNRPVIRLFGKTADGEPVCAFYSGLKPYFYVKLTNESVVKEKSKELRNFLSKTFPGIFENIEIVKKFFPNGYQKEKIDLVKITLTGKILSNISFK